MGGRSWVGRSVTCYVNYPDDVEPLETFVRESTDVLFLRPRTATPEPVHAGSLLIPASETWRELLIGRAVFVPRLRWHHSPAQGMWFIDKGASPVIEYSPGYGRDGTPHFPRAAAAPGRMWFQTRTWDGDTPVRPPGDFIAWADRVLRWVRRNWVLIEDFYFSPPRRPRPGRRGGRSSSTNHGSGPGAEQISRWRRAHDPENLMLADDFRATVTKARKDQPKKLIISIRRKCLRRTFSSLSGYQIPTQSLPNGSVTITPLPTGISNGPAIVAPPAAISRAASPAEATA